MAVQGGRDCTECHAVTSKIALPRGTNLVPDTFLAQHELLLCSCTPRCCGTMLWERGCSSGPGLRATLDLSLHPLELCPGWSGGSEALWGLFIWMQPVS